VPELIAYGRVQTPVLGVTLFTQAQADYYRRNRGIEGVIVLGVVSGGDLDRQGMRGLTQNNLGWVLGDVIVEIDGIAISNEDDLLTVLENRRAGDTVAVMSRRANRIIEYQVRLSPAQGL